MAQTSLRHHEVDEHGRGLCSVPMWCMGLPAGFCDREAYGKRPHSKEYRAAYTGEVFRADGRYAGYVPGLACPEHGGPTIRVFRDGNMWCAVRHGFTNLQESPAGFGDTPEDALAALRAEGGGG